MNRSRLTLAALAVSAVAALALGQNADQNTSGPTKNDYRLRVVEPVEGAMVSGTTVRVAVNTQIASEVGATGKKDGNSMPRPDIEVFLDNEHKGTMRDANNVLTIDGVAKGDHSIVVVATNRSGEIIDRKEVHFSSAPETQAAATTSQPKASPDSTLVPADHSATSSGSTSYAPVSKSSPSSMSPAPPPAHVAVAAAPPMSTSSANERKALPKTATSDPLLVSAGVLLLAGGLALRKLK